MGDSEENQTESGRSLMSELAHELRDALSPLASSVDLARLRNFDPEASRLLAQKVERGLRRALALLDTFVLAEQCENGALPLQVRPVRLQEILQNARDTLGGADHYAFAAADGGITVRADPARSAQVLGAVLQHAVTTATHERAVEACAAGTAAQPEIRVRGRIDPANVPGEEWFASYRGGDGGMALRTARRIMMLQGGSLELVSSHPSEFELVMRFAAERGRPEAQSETSLQKRRAAPARTRAADRAGDERVLIVEDSPEVRRAYREALVALGYTVLEAADAEQALDILENARPEVALIDIHLPRMNGYRLAQAIRARAGAGVYLVMLSGMALDAVTRGLAREAGFDDCLDKMAGPIALRELLEARGGRG